MSALGAAAGEEIVAALNHPLHHRLLLGGHTLIHHVHLQIRVRIGAHAINVQPHFIAQFAPVGHYAEDADRARERGRLGVDIIGIARDVVSARCRIITHRDNHGQSFLFQQFHAMPDLFAGVRATTRAIHA